LKLSLKPGDKLKLKADFDHVRAGGRKFSARLLVAVVSETPDSKTRCGVVCGRKFSPKAVERNRARRLLWESFRLLKPRISPCHMILIPRAGMLQAKTQDSMSQLERLLKDAGRLSPAAKGEAPE
jgi:ribonuclease P protein component